MGALDEAAVRQGKALYVGNLLYAPDATRAARRCWRAWERRC